MIYIARNRILKGNLPLSIIKETNIIPIRFPKEYQDKVDEVVNIAENLDLIDEDD